jgi:hypothetical protein
MISTSVTAMSISMSVKPVRRVRDRVVRERFMIWLSRNDVLPTVGWDQRHLAAPAHQILT